MRLTVLMAGCVFLVMLAPHIHAADNAQADPVAIDVQTVEVKASRADTLKISIPRSALTMRNGIPGVFVLQNDTARFRMLRVGKAGAKRVDILSGLFGDEILLNSNLESLHDGSRINVSGGITAGKK